MRARALRTAPTDAERSLWQALRNRQLDGYKFRRQHPVGRYFADFACVEAGLVVELDGGQHFEPVAARADAERTAALSALGFHVLRYTNREALTERDAVLAAILNWLNSNHPHPNPLPPAGEGAGNHPDSLPSAGEEANTKEPSHG
ncbi:endonuclease domain-containing protein [Methylibium sp.]|uniref:endonuclease domain-containing protein n=1 Tax=Methylibium sp. TaxID=2067992 RepID=UPI00333F4347